MRDIVRHIVGSVKTLWSGFLLMAFIVNNAIGQTNDLKSLKETSNMTKYHNQLRQMFLKDQKEFAVKQMISIAEKKSDTDPIALAYVGTGKSMLAEYTISPWSKYRFFVEGTKLLDQAISENSGFDGHILRMIVQLNCPGFLNYHSNLNADCKAVCSLFETCELPSELKEKMIVAVIEANNESDQLTDAQVNELKNLIRNESYSDVNITLP